MEEGELLEVLDGPKDVEGVLRIKAKARKDQAVGRDAERESEREERLDHSERQ